MNTHTEKEQYLEKSFSFLIPEEKTRIKDKMHTEELPSVRDDKRGAVAVDRNTEVAAKKLPPMRMDDKNINFRIEGISYFVRSVPFLFNDEVRFRIIINGNAGHVLVRDPESGQLRAINDDASILPDGLEQMLSEKLQLV